MQFSPSPNQFPAVFLCCIWRFPCQHQRLLCFDVYTNTKTWATGSNVGNKLDFTLTLIRSSNRKKVTTVAPTILLGFITGEYYQNPGHTIHCVHLLCLEQAHIPRVSVCIFWYMFTESSLVSLPVTANLMAGSAICSNRLNVLISHVTWQCSCRFFKCLQYKILTILTILSPVSFLCRNCCLWGCRISALTMDRD